MDTHKLNTIRIRVPLNEIHSISVSHPLTNHLKPAGAYCHTEERYGIRMAAVFPCDSFSAESLTPFRQREAVDVGTGLTRSTSLASLVKYALTTLTATGIPLCVCLKMPA